MQLPKDLESRAKLAPGHTAKLESARQKGTLSETDICTYLVTDPSGKVVGKIVYTDHTPLGGRRRAQSITHTDSSGVVIAEEHWSGALRPNNSCMDSSVKHSLP